MKILITLLVTLLAFSTFAQTTNYLNDTKTVESTITTLYEVISGGPGVERDWARFKNLFKPEGRLIPTRKDDQGNLIIKALSPDEYIEFFTPRIATGFFERELNRKVEEFGTVVHAFSTYETRDQKDGPATNRGINSIQLFKDNDRYYIVNVYWCAESMGFELPKKYVSNKK
ncbi:MAG: hypothetical protein RI909_145 [Bacteroidota bacterium]|jgi:hypothetical protein